MKIFVSIVASLSARNETQCRTTTQTDEWADVMLHGPRTDPAKASAYPSPDSGFGPGRESESNNERGDSNSLRIKSILLNSTPSMPVTVGV